MIEYESFFAPQNYWDALNRMNRTSYIKKYYAENGVYPTQEQINSIVLSEDEIEKYNRQYYAKYLVKLYSNGNININPPTVNLNTPNFSEWIELPSPNDDSLEYYCHYFSVGDEKYRNYSFAWSQKDRISKWVAYPLHKNSIYFENNVGRTEAYSLDPILGENSSAPFDHYAGNYARGRLVQSVDRQYSDESNSQIFYGTNIVPLVNVVNETIHNEVSTYIRYLAYNSNECYVVVGVITDNNSIVETDSYGNSVTVPSVIYRIALAINGDTYRVLCCSYNNNDDINLQFHTISELEEMTGICYFPNLKTIVGDEKYFEIKNLISEKI